MNGLSSVRDRVMGTASSAGHAIGDTAGGTVDTIKGTPDAVVQQTQGNPLVAGAVAFGVGVLMASVFPASAKEQEVADQLKDKAQPLADDLKQTGQEIGRAPEGAGAGSGRECQAGGGGRPAGRHRHRQGAPPTRPERRHARGPRPSAPRAPVTATSSSH